MVAFQGLRIMVFGIGISALGNVYADALPTGNSAPSAEEMSLDDFLTTFMDLVPKEVCDGFKGDSEIWTIMEKKNITVEKCIELTKDLTESCVKKYKNKLPENFDNERLTKWSKQVGYCIGLEYASKYIYNDDYMNSPPENKAPKDVPVTTEPSGE
jgi:hypothetical protein